MDDVEIPQYFICPISLQIMKDPVTVITGITYDRQSIEQWLLLPGDSGITCPVTRQPLPKNSDLTPNHTLRRLIQAWCMLNASKGVDRIPTPKSPLDAFHVTKILRDLRIPPLQSTALNMLVNLGSESERNRNYMVEAGVVKVVVSLIKRLIAEKRTQYLEEALKVLSLIPITVDDIGVILNDFAESVTWILRRMDKNIEVKIRALSVMRLIVEKAKSSVLDRLKPDFFEVVVQVLRNRMSHLGVKCSLYILLGTCPWGRNKMKMIQSGVVFDLIELELSTPDKRTTELVFGILDHLCSCADGRAKFLSHSAGIAMLTKRILRVSTVADDRAVRVLAWICKFSATKEVLQEMLKVGGVSKLCMVLQADCTSTVKEKAKEVLRMHSNVWSNSPCISIYLLTRYPTLQ